ncbi:MAG TPA: PaaI family thioesterase [Thermoplasmata archaeon]|nr:PaaI family thioesterase [Thermoplasmata archaeon]
MARLVGFRLVDIRRGRSTVELPAGPQHANPMGTIHGGILCDIADAAMGMAYASTISPRESFTTIELKVNFLRPFWTGRISAHGRVLRKGRTIGLVECRLKDGEGRLVAFATSTCLTIAGSAEDGIRRPRRPVRSRRE